MLRRGGGSICVQRKSDTDNRQLQSWLKETAHQNKDAFASLYQALIQPVSHYVRIHIDSSEDAKDVIQEVFIAIWRGADSYSGQSSVLSWVLAVSRKKVADHYRKKYRHARWMAGESMDDGRMIKVKDEASTKEIAEIVQKVYWERLMQRPSPQARELIYLSFVLGLTYREIAAIQEVRPGTIKSRMYAVRQKLMKLIREEGST
ncbi:MAG: RNA polymerase sigma factor [Clostridia bacterium]